MWQRFSISPLFRQHFLNFWRRCSVGYVDLGKHGKTVLEIHVPCFAEYLSKFKKSSKHLPKSSKHLPKIIISLPTSSKNRPKPSKIIKHLPEPAKKSARNPPKTSSLHPHRSTLKSGSHRRSCDSERLLGLRCSFRALKALGPRRYGAAPAKSRDILSGTLPLNTIKTLGFQ